MQWPKYRRFQKKPSAGASNNGRINGTRVCVCVCVCVCPRVLLWRWLGERCRMSYPYSAIPHFQELFDCPSYVPIRLAGWLNRNYLDSVEITNKMQPCNRIYYSTVHLRLNMFRAAYRSSSWALNCISSLCFTYACGDRP